MLTVKSCKVNLYKYLTTDMHFAEFKYFLMFGNDHRVLTICYSFSPYRVKDLLIRLFTLVKTYFIASPLLFSFTSRNGCFKIFETFLTDIFASYNHSNDFINSFIQTVDIINPRVPFENIKYGRKKRNRDQLNYWVLIRSQ